MLIPESLRSALIGLVLFMAVFVSGALGEEGPAKPGDKTDSGSAAGNPAVTPAPREAGPVKPGEKADVAPAADNPAVKPAPRRDHYWLRRHAANVARARQGGIDVLFIGDSITDWWSGPGRAVWEKEFAPLNAANFGISADQTQHVLARLNDGELEGIAPKAVLLLIGTNNLKSGPTRMAPQHTAAGVRAIVELVKTKLPRTRVLVLGILPRQPEYEWMSEAIRQTNALLKELADGGRVRFLDFGAKLLQPDGSFSRQIMPDLLHLSAAGYQIWADAVREPVREMLK
jgi:beta-glucosidase